MADCGMGFFGPSDRPHNIKTFDLSKENIQYDVERIKIQTAKLTFKEIERVLLG